MNDKLNKLIEFSIDSYSYYFASDCVLKSVEYIITEYVENEDAVGDPAYESICSLYNIRGIPWTPIKASIEDYFGNDWRNKQNYTKYFMGFFAKSCSKNCLAFYKDSSMEYCRALHTESHDSFYAKYCDAVYTRLL